MNQHDFKQEHIASSIDDNRFNINIKTFLICKKSACPCISEKHVNYRLKEEISQITCLSLLQDLPDI